MDQNDISKYLNHTYDKYTKKDVRLVLKHTKVFFDPFMNYKVKTIEQFLVWLKLKDEKEFRSCIDSMKIESTSDELRIKSNERRKRFRTS